MRQRLWGSFRAAAAVLALTRSSAAVARPTRTRNSRLPSYPRGRRINSGSPSISARSRPLDKYGVEIIWNGPPKEDNRSDQINVVENFITRGVDGICLAPLDARGLVGVVKSAQREKIPTVIFDSGLDSPDAFVSYVATDNYNGGALAAREMGKLLGGQRPCDPVSLRDRQRKAPRAA